MLKSEFPAEEPWFTNNEVHLDLGYQGVQTAYQGENICIPHKKPRKSKHKTNPQLTLQQKRENQALAKLRVPIEHAIGGIKRFRSLVTPYRNHRDGFEDDLIAISAGLWNFWLS